MPGGRGVGAVEAVQDGVCRGCMGRFRDHVLLPLLRVRARTDGYFILTRRRGHRCKRHARENRRDLHRMRDSRCKITAVSVKKVVYVFSPGRRIFEKEKRMSISG